VTGSSCKFVTGTATGKLRLYDIETSKLLSEIVNSDPKLKYNSISSIQALQSNLYCYGMKNGTISIADFRTNRQILRNAPKIHDNGVNYIEISESRLNLVTSGRDNSIKYFDTRYLTPKVIKNRNEIPHIWDFRDHLTEDLNIQPCFLQGGQYIATGSKESFLYFYDTDTGMLAHHYETNLAFVPVVVSLENLTKVPFSVGVISCSESEMTLLQPIKGQTKESEYILSMNDLFRMKITEFMSKNSEVFFDLLLSGELNESNSSWENLVTTFASHSNPTYRRLARDV